MSLSRKCKNENAYSTQMSQHAHSNKYQHTSHPKYGKYAQIWCEEFECHFLRSKEAEEILISWQFVSSYYPENTKFLLGSDNNILGKADH